jgi:ankyrin repeat protein
MKPLLTLSLLLLPLLIFAANPPSKKALDRELRESILMSTPSGEALYDSELVVNEKTKSLQENKLTPPRKISELLEKGANPNAKYADDQTALMLAVEHNREDTVKLLLDAGADVQAVDKKGRSALHVACQMAYTKPSTIELLLDKGANIDAQTKDDLKLTPLMTAVLSENEAVVKTLLQRSANVTLRAETGETALDMAKQTKKKSLIDLFQTGGQQ